jgi:hypothetical protein
MAEMHYDDELLFLEDGDNVTVHTVNGTEIEIQQPEIGVVKILVRGSNEEEVSVGMTDNVTFGGLSEE